MHGQDRPDLFSVILPQGSLHCSGIHAVPPVSLQPLHPQPQALRQAPRLDRTHQEARLQRRLSDKIWLALLDVPAALVGLMLALLGGVGIALMLDKFDNTLKSREDVDSGRVGAVALGTACLPLMHAATFNPDIQPVIMAGSPVSYRSIAMNRIYRIGLIRREGGGTHHPYEVDFSWGIPGVLTAYDLPDLIACMAPRKVILADLQNHGMEPASDELIDREMAFPRSVYGHHQAAGNLRIIRGTGMLSSLVDWGFR